MRSEEMGVSTLRTKTLLHSIPSYTNTAQEHCLAGRKMMYAMGMKKSILIIVGHPDAESYCSHLARHYALGARRAGAEVTVVQLSECTFDPILHRGYKEIQTLEEDLVALQKKITETDKLVFVYPTWWGGPPALLKGFIERVFLPGFGFRFHKNSFRWDRLLKGRSARIITTMDAPKMVYAYIFGAPGDKMMKRVLLIFCGFRPVQVTHVDKVSSRGDTWRKAKISEMEKLGALDARHTPFL